AQLHQAARGGAAAGRGAGAEVFYGLVEEGGEALAQGACSKRLLQRADIVASVALVGDQEQRFLAAEGIVETAALNAGVGRGVGQRRAAHALAPELLEGDAQHIVVVELARSHGFLLCGRSIPSS